MVWSEDANAGKTPWEMTKEGFDLLMSRLDMDSEVAGQKYEDLRLMLIKLFENRNIHASLDHADEVINRLTRKLTGEEEIRIEDQLSEQVERLPQVNPPVIPSIELGGGRISSSELGTASPGQRRAISLLLPRASRFARVRVLVNSVGYRSYVLSLRDQSDNQVWRRTELAPRNIGPRQVISILIPASVFKSGVYTFVLLGERDGSTEFIAIPGQGESPVMYIENDCKLESHGGSQPGACQRGIMTVFSNQPHNCRFRAVLESLPISPRGRPAGKCWLGTVPWGREGGRVKVLMRL